MRRYSIKSIFLLLVGLVFLFSVSMPAMAKTEAEPAPYMVGKWLPSDQQTLNKWRAKLISQATSAPNAKFLPVIQEFKDLIENDPQLYMLFTEMFDQLPNEPKFKKDPVGNPQIQNYMQMLQVMNVVMTHAPEFNKTGLVGFPINAILDWPMGTHAGSAAFLNPKVNRQLKKILNKWAVFLDSPDSLYVLNKDPEHGWFGRDAQKAMPTFVKDFICDPNKPYYGFKSWDDFFTRTFRKGRRPVASPKDDSVIANACESAPYKIARNIKFRDTFWIKSQPYSLVHMFGGDAALANEFKGGTAYQAFLSALSYHRWNSPVSGTIVKTENIDGSYYAEAQRMGFDEAGPNESQGYITNVASRGLVLIQADNPDIGLMAVLFVGMAEVSSNEFTVYAGQHVNKGDQLGMFHFGGSTYVLLFRPGVNIKFDLHGEKPGLYSHNIPVRSRIGVVQKGKNI